jgi:thioredoxin-related protein
MKRIILALTLVLLGLVSFSQNTVDTVPPYKRFPTVPAYHLLETDSATIATKDQLKKNIPVLIIVFNPECDHCKHETEEILKHMDDFKKVQIVMATMAPHALMKEFSEKYKLNEYDNIKVGQDFQYLLPSFYRLHSLPYLAMYDKKGKLISTFEGTMKMEDLIAVFK